MFRKCDSETEDTNRKAGGGGGVIITEVERVQVC